VTVWLPPIVETEEEMLGEVEGSLVINHIFRYGGVPVVVVWRVSTGG
jgi:hypothetical protein